MKLKIKSNHKKLKITGITLLIILVTLVGAFCFYISDYSKAQEEAITAMENSSITVIKFDNGVAFGDTNAQSGFIFYPGGKVEYSAYAPLLQKIAGPDVFCILVKMPFNLAVFDSDAAADIMPMFPEIKHWFIGGHSLGGAMAADYASKNSEEFDGLILLGAYSATDLASSKLAVISVYGSEDTVLNLESFDKGRDFMPTDYKEIFIEGGNHAQFGDYGLQKGDGVALITADKQREITSAAINEFIKNDEIK